MVNGKPQAATVVDGTTGKAPPPRIRSIMDFDPDNLPTITATYASTSAVLLTIDFDLAASGVVDLLRARRPTT